MSIRFSISDRPVFPHVKLTDEPFPRALATRILKDDGDEYFGAFLSRTNARILIDFLNKTFRLRSCAIEVDGSFPVPCTQYYARRCVAPCVSSLCDRDRYLEMVNLVRLFLRNDRELLLSSLSKKIERAAEELEFETAAFFRDILQKVEWFWSQPRYKVWLHDTVDTIDLHADDEAVYVIILSQRGRRTLGEIIYPFAGLDEPPRALREVIEQFYKFHLPREIRVSHDFDGRAELAAALGKKFGRKINISIAGDANRRITAERAIAMTKARLDLERRKARPTTDQLIKQLRQEFSLGRSPHRIEAFDAAHISATGFAAGASVWDYGEDRLDEYEHWTSDRSSELDTLRAFVDARVSRTSPDLVLIDGGRSQLKAAIEVVGSRADVISAVKPAGKHSSISHFLTSDGQRIEFDIERESHRLLRRLRDEAHDLANATHRLGRDMLHFYELAAIVPSFNERERHDLLREVGSIRKIVELDNVFFENRFGKKKGARGAKDIARYHAGKSAEPQPLIVPIRFVDPDGAAGDLIPIETR